MSNPRITVILPVYNAAAFVAEAIDSILKQDYSDIELLVADDGSTDNSLEIIRSFSDSRMRVLVNEQNLGLIGTLNRLIRECKTDYIARMDGDDISAYNRLSLQMNAMSSNPDLGVVSSFMGVIHEPGRVVKHRFLEDSYIKAALPFMNPIVHPAVLFRRSKLPAGDLYDKKYLHAEDYGLWMELIAKASFKVIPLPLLHHRAHEGQVSVSHYEQQKRSIAEAHRSFCSKLKIVPTEDELQLQLSLFLEKFSTEPGYVDHVETWLMKLVNANRQEKLIPAFAFEETCGEWWFRVCQSLNAGVKRYGNSPLAEMYSPPLKSKAKLIAKSIVAPKRSKKH